MPVKPRLPLEHGAIERPFPGRSGCGFWTLALRAGRATSGGSPWPLRSRRTGRGIPGRWPGRPARCGGYCPVPPGRGAGTRRRIAARNPPQRPDLALEHRLPDGLDLLVLRRREPLMARRRPLPAPATQHLPGPVAVAPVVHQDQDADLPAGPLQDPPEGSVLLAQFRRGRWPGSRCGRAGWWEGRPRAPRRPDDARPGCAGTGSRRRTGRG